MTKEQKDEIREKLTELAASLIDLKRCIEDILNDDDNDIQHVGYDDEQLGREK